LIICFGSFFCFLLRPSEEDEEEEEDEGAVESAVLSLEGAAVAGLCLCLALPLCLLPCTRLLSEPPEYEAPPAGPTFRWGTR
jgi:hypothetical protein